MLRRASLLTSFFVMAIAVPIISLAESMSFMQICAVASYIRSSSRRNM